MSERATALKIANERDALEFAARVLQARASMVPVGHEDVTKGPSTYNWLTYAVRLIREEAAALPPGDAPQTPRAVDVLRRLRGWDVLDATADGPYWKREIDAVLGDAPQAGGASPQEETAFLADALAAAVADRDHSDARLAAIDAALREVCPVENSESDDEDDPEPRYICMDEDANRLIEADDMPTAIRQIIAAWGQAAEAKREASLSPVAPQTCEWQPIETAPKDATVLVDLWFRGRRETDCKWWPMGECWIKPGDARANFVTPTHWMPRPAPPQEEPIRPPVEGQTP